ncbi:MAG: class I SAM-dependent methyltransferase [Armatimonadota bacterium]
MNDFIQEIHKWDAVYAAMDNYDETPELKRFNEEFAEFVSSFLPIGSRILEAGCGAGWQSLALGRTKQYDIHLLDFSTEALNFAKRLFEKEQVDATFHHGDVFADGLPEFDLVFNAGVIEHYDYTQQLSLLRGMRSRSRKWILVLAPNSLCYWYWAYRVSASIKAEWVYGKEIPITDLCALFNDVGIPHVKSYHLGASWTESFINSLSGMSDELKEQIISIHRSNILPDSERCYLTAGIARIDGLAIQEMQTSTRLTSQRDDLTSSLFADSLSMLLMQKNELARKDAIITKFQNARRYLIADKIARLLHLVTDRFVK